MMCKRLSKISLKCTKTMLNDAFYQKINDELKFNMINSMNVKKTKTQAQTI